MICQWIADQLFAEAEGRDKSLICETLTNRDILLNKIVVMFKKRTGVFYRVYNHEAQPSSLDPIKHVL